MVRTFGSSIGFILSTAKNSLTIQRSMKQELAVGTKSSYFKCQLLSRLRVKRQVPKPGNLGRRWPIVDAVTCTE